MAAITRTETQTVRIILKRGDIHLFRDALFNSSENVSTAPVTTAVRGRYILCSKTQSGLGIKLEVGDRTMKKNSPRNPADGHRRSMTNVSKTSKHMNMTDGSASSIRSTRGQA